MRRDVFLAAAETVVAVLCLVGLVAAWQRGVVSTAFLPVGDIPGFESSRYAGPWLILAVFLVAVAGLCVIDALARVLGSRNR
ncbi:MULTISPECIES: hypothetical protein [Nocardia]|uniref:Uncharacterized protein n=2 Tax=Nocardia farcinica TaxID=37329 RepID=Q5YP76_NOCFA|nr:MULTISPECIES: hypothetical protein [Nocardia]MBF6141145.1 hypothetical protein [Nocardia farcinica]MBF6187008.1 hypothetical protein [Nocardia farcinica]MBF6232007.1 hypothetical protein [Nocardia farcinica]MBF6246584.1 hypothetical protein [Nocardia elegans]MBF6311904.1 hypothetical protein [Nocardia farcinica]